MQAAQRPHRFIDPLVNACVLTLGLYIATVPVAPSSSKGMEPAIDAASPLQSTPSPVQKRSESLSPTPTHPATSNRGCMQEIWYTLSHFVFRQSG
jgi:hypothetical protein